MFERAGPSPYTHWMQREIHEQPATIQSTLERYVKDGRFVEESCAPVREWLSGVQGKIVLAASGSSRHAAMVAEILIEDASGLAVDVEYASEYAYRGVPLGPSDAHAGTGLLVVSQSGETADTLAALRRSRGAGQRTLAITNVASSTMAREAGGSFPTMAGRERAVPATKSLTAQMTNLFLLALLAAERQGTMDQSTIHFHLQALEGLPQRLARQMTDWESSVRAISSHYAEARSFLFLGRGVHYPIAREGALKLKESSYLHAEGYPTGELKHGPNALVTEGIPLVMLATVDRSDADSVARYDRVVHLMGEMREQGVDILAIGNRGDAAVAKLATHLVVVEEATEWLLPFYEVVPLQMLAYFVAVANGVDVDHPRNLVKAVVHE